MTRLERRVFQQLLSINRTLGQADRPTYYSIYTEPEQRAEIVAAWKERRTVPSVCEEQTAPGVQLSLWN